MKSITLCKFGKSNTYFLRLYIDGKTVGIQTHEDPEWCKVIFDEIMCKPAMIEMLNWDNPEFYTTASNVISFLDETGSMSDSRTYN